MQLTFKVVPGLRKNKLSVRDFIKFFGILVVLVVVSCDSSDETSPIDTGKDHFPLHKGHFQIYDVTETKYTLGVPETFEFELKTVITDSFANAGGNFTYVIHRSKRSSGETDFVDLDTWSARIDNREAVVNEENVPFLKIKLPIAKGREWNGNTYNTQVEDIYALEEVQTSFAVNGETFADCIVINQNDNQDFVVILDQRQEVYAKNVGLIYKEVTLLNYCTIGSCLGQQQVESGVIYKQSIKSYGVE